MSLKDVVAVILRHFTHSCSFRSQTTESRPIVSATEMLPKDYSFCHYVIRECW